MFGYIKPFKPNLLVREYEEYKGVYCGLCKRLRRLFGPLLPLTLSYDFVFVAMLKTAVSGGEAGYERCRCSYNPLKKCSRATQNDELDFAARCGVLLMYHKLRDDLQDEGFFRRLFSRGAIRLLKGAYRKAASALPEVDAACRSFIEEQTRVEASGKAGVDESSAPTARALSLIFSSMAEDEGKRRVLDRLGLCLGKWIYLVDAADDQEKDRAKGRYNPYLALQKDDLPGYIGSTLNMCAAEAAAAFEQLGARQYDMILKNILYEGLYAVSRQILEKERST